MSRICVAVCSAVIAASLSAQEQSGAPSQETLKKAEQLLRESVAASGRKRQERSVAAHHHLQAGKQLFSQFEYEAARDEFQDALLIEPQNAEARKMLEQVESILGVRRSRVKSAATDLYQHRKVSIEEQRLEIDNAIALAKKYIKEAETDRELELVHRLRRYELALAQLERAKELLNWMPVGERPPESALRLNELFDHTERRSQITQTHQKNVERERASKRK